MKCNFLVLNIYLFFRYEHGYWWPNLPESNFTAIGEGDGKGFNINIPLNVTGILFNFVLHKNSTLNLCGCLI